MKELDLTEIQGITKDSHNDLYYLWIKDDDNVYPFKTRKEFINIIESNFNESNTK